MGGVVGGMLGANGAWQGLDKKSRKQPHAK